MSVTYDRKLIFNTTSKTIDPCCRTMDLLIIRGIVYGSAQKGKIASLMLRDPGNPKKGYGFIYCPFCRAMVEKVEQ